jgi:putative transposase
VIRMAVLFYGWYRLSLWNAKDLLFENGIDICHEIVWFW